MEQWVKEAAARRAHVVRSLEEQADAKANAGKEQSREPLKPAINIWGYRNPLTAGTQLTAHARVKCFDGRSLAGASIKIIDPKTGKVAGSTRLGTDEDTKNGILEGDITMNVPADPGFHKWTILVDAKDQPDIIAQKNMPFSVVPQSDRTVMVRCVDDKTGKPVANATVFFYDANLEKTSPLRAVSDEDGYVTCKLVSGAPYKVEAVAEDYCQAFSEIPGEPSGKGGETNGNGSAAANVAKDVVTNGDQSDRSDNADSEVYEVEMRNKFNVRMRTAYF